MDTKELRIGNYVYRQSSKLIVDKSDVYQIENINLQSALKYEPITLTEEWLIKFGFKENQYSWRKGEWEHKKFHLYKSSDENIFYRQIWTYNPGIEDSDWNIQDEEREIKYLHELQNYFYAVNGEELTINN